MTHSPPDVKPIFGRALDFATPAERARYLDEACHGDAALRAEVDELIGAVARAGNFLGPALPPETAADEQAREDIGTVIGPYKLLEQIGEGGMGLVYMAQQQQPVRRRVALKIIKPGMDSRQIVARFEAERQALAVMDHANIAKVLDAGTTESGRSYFVMELVSGVPITRFCDEQRLTIRERLQLFLPVCQALQHAHQKGIIHRDIKPTNVLIALYDGIAVPKVIDFGVAKATEQKLTEKTLFTGFGQLIGTLEYMSPEQAQFNQLDIDTRSDIYSLGVLLYELLTGTTPLEQSRLRTAAFEETLRIIREEEPPKPSTRLSKASTLPALAANCNLAPAQLRRQVTGDLDWIVLKCLEKDRTRRYQTASGLELDVRRYLADEPVAARSPSRAYLLSKFVRRNQGAVVSAVLILVALVGGIIGTTWGMIRAETARRIAVAAQHAERERAEGERRAKEEAQRRLAQIERGTQTLASLFRDVDPLVAEEEGVTLRVLLGRRLGEAAHELEGETVGDPLVVARLQQVLGISLHELGQLQQAEAALTKACRTRERLLGVDHLDTAATRHHLAMLYRAQGKYDLAELQLSEALQIRTTRLGADDPDTLDSQLQLAAVYHSQRKFDLAEKVGKEVVDRRAASLSPDDADLLASQHRLAAIYRSQGKYELAQSLCQEVLNRRTAQLGAGNLHTLASKRLLAAIYLSQEKYALAEGLYRQILAHRTVKLGHDHPDTIGTMHHLAIVHASMNRFGDSIPLLEEALKLSREKLDPDYPSSLRIKADLAASYYEVGQFADATALLEDDGENEGRRSKMPVDAEAALHEALARLAELNEAVGRPGTAAKWRERLKERAAASEK